MEARAAARQALGLQLLAAGELWYTLRPLLYVLSLRRCARARARLQAVPLSLLHVRTVVRLQTSML